MIHMPHYKFAEPLNTNNISFRQLRSQGKKMPGEQSLPERPAEDANAPEGGEKLSKKALKKLEKDKEKVHHPRFAGLLPDS